MASSSVHPVIRPATVEDADAIGLIHRVSQRMAATDSLPAAAQAVSAAEHGQEWRDWLRLQATGRATGFVLVVDTRQGVAGFICAVPPRPTAGKMTGGAWVIQHHAVLPAFHGQGLGRRLFSAALGRLHTAGASRIEMVTFRNNPWRPLLLHLGWQEVGEEVLTIARTVLPATRYRREVGLEDGLVADAPADSGENGESAA